AERLRRHRHWLASTRPSHCLRGFFRTIGPRPPARHPRATLQRTFFASTIPWPSPDSNFANGLAQKRRVALYSNFHGKGNGLADDELIGTRSEGNARLHR